jgi:ketosteroid isomerase-like protein
MSQENVELVRRVAEAVQRHEYRVAVGGFHEDAVWENTAEFPGPRRCVGREEIVAFWTSLYKSFEETSTTLERLLDRGSIVVVEVHSVGRATSSGVPLDLRWTAVYELRDGSVNRVEVHGDWLTALKAVGLEE